jgi:hypothetical protein
MNAAEHTAAPWRCQQIRRSKICSTNFSLSFDFDKLKLVGTSKTALIRTDPFPRTKKFIPSRKVRVIITPKFPRSSDESQRRTIVP